MKVNSMYYKRKIRCARVRKKLKSVASGRLRLCIFRSNCHMEAQVIDDSVGHTLLCVSTLQKWFSGKSGGNISAAIELGKKFAEMYKKIDFVKLYGDGGLNGLYFDRGHCAYHGRVKSFAESVKESGISIGGESRVNV